mgnify:FL=1
MDIMSYRKAGVIAAVTVFSLAASAAYAQDFSFGERLFLENCSACHGNEGRGDGSVGVLFSAQPKSLRSLENDNNGQFPFSEIYQSIKGETSIEAHGIEMPVWGSAFTADVMSNPYITGPLGEELVQGRILALVYYLQSIQD